MPQLAVTGSTGRVGGRVARALSAHGVDQRLVVRDAARAPALPGADVAVADYADADAARRALDGITTLFMVSGTEAVDRLDQHRTFVAAAAEAGVRHVVYTSFAGAAADSVFTLGRDHWATEDFIRARGLHHTFLRDNFYADFLPLMAGEDGVIRGPAGSGRVAAVAVADVADAAATVVRAPEQHLDVTYTLTGPEALTLTEAATIITAASGRTVSFRNETRDEAYESRARYGAPDWQVEAWVSTYAAIAQSEVETVTADVPTLLGRPATSLAQLLADVRT